MSFLSAVADTLTRRREAKATPDPSALQTVKGAVLKLADAGKLSRAETDKLADALEALNMTTEAVEEQVRDLKRHRFLAGDLEKNGTPESVAAELEKAVATEKRLEDELKTTKTARVNLFYRQAGRSATVTEMRDLATRHPHLFA